MSFDPCLAPPIKRILITKDVTEMMNAGPEIKKNILMVRLDPGGRL